MFYVNTYTSFFDDTNKPPRLWTKVAPEEAHASKYNKIYSGYLYKKGRKSKMIKKGIFHFTEDGLLYSREEKPESIKKIMKHDINIRYKFFTQNDMISGAKDNYPDLPKEFKAGVLIMKSGIHFILYAEDLDAFFKWKALLISKGIIHTFHTDFEVQKLIGKGSFAKVFLAKKKDTNKEFAIKAFSKEYLLTQNKGKEGLVNEIAIMRRLNHEHTIKLYELHESENSVYLVLELVKGGELVSRLKSATNYSEFEVKMLLKNFLSALVHVHKNKIMHRDLKPENILLRNQTDLYDIVLADFGLAAFMTEEELLFKRCGTPGFVAPEVLHYKEGGQMYDEKCDIFSAGIIFYLLLSGKRPFDGKDYKVILQENKKCQINFDLPIFKKVSPEALSLMKLMLEENPKKRPNALECLDHNYFNDTMNNSFESEESYHDLGDLKEQFLHLNSMKYSVNNDFESTESGIIMRKPALNGRVDTFEHLNKFTNQATISMEINSPSKSKPAMQSKFSIAIGQNNRFTFEETPALLANAGASKDSSGDSSPNKAKRSNTGELHRIALINSSQKYGDGRSPSGKGELRAFPDKKIIETPDEEVPEENASLNQKLSNLNVKEISHNDFNVFCESPSSSNLQ